MEDREEYDLSILENTWFVGKVPVWVGDIIVDDYQSEWYIGMVD